MTRLEGDKAQVDFTYHGKLKQSGITEHRILEIQKFADLGTPWTNAPWYFEHHSKQAIIELESHIEHWDFMAKHLGREDIFIRVKDFIIRGGERIHPACFAISDADLNGSACKSYQKIEKYWYVENLRMREMFKAQKDIAPRYRKQAIRNEEIAAAKMVLTNFYIDASTWVDAVKNQM